jgi:hypothetical protein
LWGDGGLKDLLVDSSVYDAGTVDQMLNGKEFPIAFVISTHLFIVVKTVDISFGFDSMICA